MIEPLWADVYRPHTINDFIFRDPKQKELIEHIIKERQLGHLLLTGHPGTGKTSLALIIKEAFNVEDIDFMMINASRKNGVEDVRTQVSNFISSQPLGDFKLVFLDEADWMTPSAQAALRGMMEEFTDSVRFILTANKSHKIIQALKSRTQEFTFKSLDRDYMLEKAAIVLTKEKVKVNDIDLLEKYVDMAFPDCRKMLNMLQQHSVTGVLTPPTETSDNMESEIKILGLIEDEKWDEIREYAAANVSDDQWEEVYRALYDYLHEITKFKDGDKWRAGILVIADSLYKHSMVADPEINFAACIIKLRNI